MHLRDQPRRDEPVLDGHEIAVGRFQEQIHTPRPDVAPDAVGGPAKRPYPIVVSARDRQTDADARLEMADPERLLPAAARDDDALGHVSVAELAHQLLREVVLLEVEIQRDARVAGEREGIPQPRCRLVGSLVVGEHELAVRRPAADVDLDHVGAEPDRLPDLGDRVVAEAGAVAPVRDVQVRRHGSSVLLRETW